jgi:crotonobetainyl-CoA:carnitine CoA-transferase CaiB-like acyl-CoA transferase
MDDPRFATMAQRSRRIPELYTMVERLTPTRSVAEWTATLQAREIPCMAVKSLEQLFDDPHLEARGTFRIVDHHSEGATTIVAPPVAFSATPSEHTRGAPLLGEDSLAVLREAGVAEAEIEALRAAGALISHANAAE